MPSLREAQLGDHGRCLRTGYCRSGDGLLGRAVPCTWSMRDGQVSRRPRARPNRCRTPRAASPQPCVDPAKVARYPKRERELMDECCHRPPRLTLRGAPPGSGAAGKIRSRLHTSLSHGLYTPIRWRDNTRGDEAGRTTPPGRYAGGRRALVIVSRADAHWSQDRDISAELPPQAAPALMPVRLAVGHPSFDPQLARRLDRDAARVLLLGFAAALPRRPPRFLNPGERHATRRRVHQPAPR